MWRKLLQDADNAGLLRPDLDPMAARMMVLGALNWAAEWWNPRRGSLDTVVRTAQSLVRHGLGIGTRAVTPGFPAGAQAPAAQAAHLIIEKAAELEIVERLDAPALVGIGDGLPAAQHVIE